MHSETFKVLGGLSRSAAPRSDAIDEEGEDQEADGDAEGEDGGAGEKTKGKSRRGGAATLEPAEAHTSRALEDAIAVDPLFQKTSAQFDEGGAAGLLMNALSVHRGCDTVFDSNEVPDYAGVDAFRGPAALSSITLDLSALAPALEPAATAFAAVVPAVLTPTLASIRALLPGAAVDTTASVAADAASFAACRPTAQAEALQDAWAEGGLFAAAPPGTDGGDTCAAVYEDDLYSGDANFGGMDDDDGDDMGTSGFGSALNDSALMGELHAGAGGAAHAGRFQMGGGGVLQWVSAASDAVGAQHRRAWAGASHWRFRAAPSTSGADAGAPAAAAPTRKTKKGPFFLDFCAPLPELDAALFAPPAKASDTRLAGAPTPADTLLPADLRYSSSQLVRLFLKPQMGPSASSAHSADQAFEPSAAADYDDDDDGGADFGGGGDFGGWDEPAADGPVASMDASLVLAPRRVEQIRVNYARSAKVVDVRALKTTLWDSLENGAPQASGDGLSFASLLQSVTPECGAGALEDVSVHMCFICLLHLANEHGLAIKGVTSLDELRITQ